MVGGEVPPAIPAAATPLRRLGIRVFAGVWRIVGVLTAASWFLGGAIFVAMQLRLVPITTGLRPDNLLFMLSFSFVGILGVLLTLSSMFILLRLRAAPVAPGTDPARRRSNAVTGATRLIAAVGLTAFSFLAAVLLAQTTPVDFDHYILVITALQVVLVLLCVANVLAWHAVLARRLTRSVATHP